MTEQTGTGRSALLRRTNRTGMTTFYTREGEVVETCARCDRRTVMEQLNRLVTEPVEVS